jgi:protein tyrosine phosphatase (PTP) superfamily phosphohydrolase (DUF442 family)
MAPVQRIYHYRLIDPLLATSGQPSEAQLRDIAEAGYVVVINLALHDDPRYSLADEAGSVQALGLDYIHIPVRFDAPSEADLASFFAAMDARRGKRIWVHCAANIRVTAFLGLYRVLRDGWAVPRAFEPMYDFWQPNAVWSAFIARALERGEVRDAY